MSNSIKRILIITSGGDAPGMNAAIRAIVRSGIQKGIEVFGCELGFQGLIDKNIYSMTAESVGNCIQRGGTILKSARCLAFLEKAVRDGCRAFLKEQGIDAIAMLGGNGSFAGAARLSDEGGPAMIGIPCTIDNDIAHTDYTIGFDTARNTALEAIDRIRDTAFSHNRHFMIEVMGRASGFLAVDVGIAGGAEIILIPEYPMTIEQITQKVNKKGREKCASIMVVAEADEPGRSIRIAKEIKERTGVHYRVCILGHTQRGGTPSLLDRKIATLMGIHAVEAILQGQKNKMVCIDKESTILRDLPKADEPARQFDQQQLLSMNNLICEA